MTIMSEKENLIMALPFLLAFIFSEYIFFQNANAKKEESYYQNIHCDNLGGEAEYKLKDKTSNALLRIDCLTDTRAIEHDFAPKWAECAGQAIYYAQRMDLKPVCALIGTEKQFKRYIPRIEIINKNLINKIEIIKIDQ